MTSSSPHENRQPLSVIEKLTKDHDPSSFDCGKSSLNDWLRRFALTNQQTDSTRTYVLHRAGMIVGYYSLCAGSVRSEESPARIAKGLAKHPIGVILLARLAVDHIRVSDILILLHLQISVRIEGSFRPFDSL